MKHLKKKNLCDVINVARQGALCIYVDMFKYLIKEILTSKYLESNLAILLAFFNHK